MVIKFSPKDDGQEKCPPFCGQKATANPNLSAGFRTNILEKARSAALYIKPQAEASEITEQYRVG
ncbi:MAG TPA: hypothetical protein VNZ03_27365 [Terriglobales bacterium]|nr:hypothetical protein [Terriglobales bacterium]